MNSWQHNKFNKNTRRVQTFTKADLFQIRIPDLESADPDPDNFDNEFFRVRRYISGSVVFT